MDILIIILVAVILFFNVYLFFKLQKNSNKEDLTEEQIYNMLQKTSEEDVKKKIGFWAMPLPKSDTDNKDTNKRYIGKK